MSIKRIIDFFGGVYFHSTILETILMRSHDESSPCNNDRKNLFFFTFWSRRSSFLSSLATLKTKTNPRWKIMCRKWNAQGLTEQYANFQFIARVGQSNIWCSYRWHHTWIGLMMLVIIFHRNLTALPYIDNNNKNNYDAQIRVRKKT